MPEFSIDGHSVTHDLTSADDTKKSRWECIAADAAWYMKADQKPAYCPFCGNHLGVR